MPKGINQTIRELADSQAGWRFHSQARLAYRLYDVMNAKLFDGKLPDPLVNFDETGRLKKDGDYQWERDGLALYGRMNLRKDLTPLETVVAVLHNLSHLEAETYAKSKKGWYHSTGFRKRMKDFGVKTNKAGDTIGLDGTFYEMLKGLVMPELQVLVDDNTLIEEVLTTGADVPLEEIPYWPWSNEEAEEIQVGVAAPQPKPKSQSKMKKWSCGCTNIRAAVEVAAVCLGCLAPDLVKIIHERIAFHGAQDAYFVKQEE